jgi:prepilin-type N-terminal cleavage/methylation domain-containing protein
MKNISPLSLSLNKPLTRHRGFTIIELGVVVVIIAILAAITTAVYIGVQQRAKDAVIDADLTQLMKSAELMKLHNGHFPQSYAEISELLKDAGLYDTTRDSGIGQKRFVFCTNKSGDKFAAVSIKIEADMLGVPMTYRSLQYPQGVIYNGRSVNGNSFSRGVCEAIDPTIASIPGGTASANTEKAVFWAHDAP